MLNVVCATNETVYNVNNWFFIHCGTVTFSECIHEYTLLHISKTLCSFGLKFFFILPPIMTSQHSYVMTSLKNFRHFNFFFGF